MGRTRPPFRSPGPGPLLPFFRPSHLPSLTSGRPTPLLSTQGTAGAGSGPPYPPENPVDRTTTQAIGSHPRPALSSAPSRNHHAPPHRPGKPRDVPHPGQRVRSHGRRSAGSRGERVPELSDLWHLGPRICQGSVRNLRLRLPRGLFLQGPGSLPLMQRQTHGRDRSPSGGSCHSPRARAPVRPLRA